MDLPVRRLRTSHQHFTQVRRVAAAHLEFDPIHHHGAPTLLEAHLADVREGDEQASMDAYEAGIAPLLLEIGQGRTKQV